ncbi:cellulase family glycosylhydrolase [Colwellia sp. E2M01]|nr:cellulase family glycosylhydrolase [Colwellia sp. E2M01]MBU2872065.1 cellulase family glycosylhydrolase [Colwellia sp. E2M01]
MIPFALTVASCGGGSSEGSSEPSPDNPDIVVDTTPNAFSFTGVSDTQLNTVVSSNEITVAGINSETSISITSGEYSLNGADYTAATATVSNGDKVKVRVTSSTLGLTPTSAKLTIGGVTSTFTVTTQSTTPDTGIQVDINFNTKHSVGGIDTFDRQKFITIHASPLENDWGENDSFSQNAANKDPDLMVNFMTDNDVYFGRDTGSIGWALRNLTEDTAKPGFIDEASIPAAANGIKWAYGTSTAKKSTDARLPQIKARSLDMIEGGQQFPYWSEDADHSNINPFPASTPWKFSQTDTAAEPFGTATGHYFGQYLSNFFRDNDTEDWKPKPKYFEIMNEPLFELTTIRNPGDDNYVTPQQVFDFHSTTAKEIRKVAKNDDIAVGGYTVAFPDFDKDNFQRWHDRDKLFIDSIGAEMDFYSIHLYDFPCFSNSERYRSGSNMEATLDMMENYSHIAVGEMKPYVISEYGAANHCERSVGWTDKKDTLVLRATNKMLMSFLERPDTIAKTIPFIVVKAEWGRTTQNGESIPYGPRLMIQEFERTGVSSQTDWTYSNLVLFYNLWSEVNGTRVDTVSSDLDIQVDAYVDGSEAYVILNNLEFDEAEVNLNALGLDTANITAINIKHLKTDGWVSKIDETNPDTLPEAITIDGEGTIVMKVTYNSDIAIDNTSNEVKYYSNDFKQAIDANTTITFNINDVVVGANGEATLRLGIGRDHGKSLQPIVTVNSTQVAVPSDFKGYDQKQGDVMKGRDNYFGVIEIPVPLTALEASNVITIEFPDAGGFVTTAALQVFTTSAALTRTK